MSRLHVRVAVDLNDGALDELRDALLASGEVLYTQQTTPGVGTIDVKHWPGAPSEWTSLVDVTDLFDAGVIERTEILEVTEGPEAWTPAGSKRWWQLWRR